MPPLVSVVVPVFNGMPHLVDLVDSLLAQDYPDVEFIFSEGGGTDSSAEFLSSITDSRVEVLHQPKGTGAAENWTRVTRAARGEFTKLICQDDILYRGALGRQVLDLSTHPEAVMAIARRDIIDAHGRVVFRNRGLAGLHEPVLYGETVIRTCYLYGTNVIGEPLAVLFRTAALRDALPWDDSNPLMLDLSMYSRVAPRGAVVARHESIGAFRVSESSWSTRVARQQLKQTKNWQEQFAINARVRPTRLERLRAGLGRHLNVGLRRAAYAVLRFRGALSRSTDA